MTFNEDEHDWHSLHPIEVQFEDCRTCDSAVEICGVQSGHQVLDQQLDMPEEDAEVAEDK
jgi:hypothetical protein